MSAAATSALLASKDDFQHALLTWFASHRRPLPWRTTPSLYRTVVSEFMLQQTQVKTVLPYFERWTTVFPDFAALAAAPEDKVLKHWEGLGYYSRARNLHRLAKAVAALPQPPTRTAEWRELPGVGPYTAAAITSIALGQPAACVDGNVVRILCRLTGDDTLHRDSGTAAKALTPLAEALLTRAQPGDHNQAMMELGATVCFRQNPLCLTCPVRGWCEAARRGTPEKFPRLAPKVIEQRAVARVWIERDGRLLLHRAASDAKRFANMHELPSAEQAGIDESALTPQFLRARRKRGITRFAITESIYTWTAKLPWRTPPDGLVWVAITALADVTLSGPHRKWITAELEKKNAPGD